MTMIIDPKVWLHSLTPSICASPTPDLDLALDWILDLAELDYVLQDQRDFHSANRRLCCKRRSK